MYVVFKKIDLSKINFEKFDANYLLILLIVFLLQLIFGALRLKKTLSIFDKYRTFKNTLLINTITKFFSSVTISGSEEIIRGFYLKSGNLNLKNVTFAILIDRIYGMLGKLALLLISILIFIYFLDEKILSSFNFNNDKFLNLQNIIFIGILFSILLILFFIFKDQLLKYIKIKHFNSFMKYFNYLFTSSLIIHILNIFLFYLVSLSLGFQFDLLIFFATVPLISFISSLPISIHGWGVREYFMIFFFSSFGIQSEQSFLISIYVGLCDLLFSMSCGICYLLFKVKK